MTFSHSFGALIKRLGLRTKALVLRYPWAVAVFGFVSGVASFFLVEREQEKFAQIVSALMLASWVWLALEDLLQRGVSSWFGLKLPPPVLSFATQMVHQESLFFVIPFFFITTAWNSGQVVFTSLLILFALVSVIDPIYYRGLARRRWLYFIFHGITLFAVLLTALPIILQLPTPKAYLLSLLIAILLSLPGVARVLAFSGWRRLVGVFVLTFALAGIGVYVRPWIPPATLRLTAVAVTTHIDNRNRSPDNQLKVVTDAQLQNGLYAYTAIRAPRGLNERIYHIWRLNGRQVDRIALDINGGREAGYRAWSHKLNFPPYPTGRWEIHVVTEAEQVIGVLRFRVVKAAKFPALPSTSPAEHTETPAVLPPGLPSESDEPVEHELLPEPPAPDPKPESTPPHSENSEGSADEAPPAEDFVPTPEQSTNTEDTDDPELREVPEQTEQESSPKVDDQELTPAEAPDNNLNPPHPPGQ